MSNLKQWAENGVYYARSGGFQAWSKESAEGALRALKLILAHNAGGGPNAQV